MLHPYTTHISTTSTCMCLHLRGLRAGIYNSVNTQVNMTDGLWLSRGPSTTAEVHGLVTTCLPIYPGTDCRCSDTSFSGGPRRTFASQLLNFKKLINHVWQTQVVFLFLGDCVLVHRPTWLCGSKSLKGQGSGSGFLSWIRISVWRCDWKPWMIGGVKVKV